MSRPLSLLAVVALCAQGSLAIAQQTVGLLVNDEQAFDGYTLFGSAPSTKVFLLDNDGLVVHEWETDYTPNLMGYLRKNGNLVRGGRVPVASREPGKRSRSAGTPRAARRPITTCCTAASRRSRPTG